ncbi:MAG TPA: CBS domain-containing protein [Alphaproteobacteria bacterium]|jgi:CBS domain-containing protein|nr:CBS domain-containing protein [Alphaproteobacteria bacterium]
MQVSQILDSKGHQVITIKPQATVAEALRVLWLEGIGALVVTDDSGKVAGMISERDVIRGLAAQGTELLEQTVEERMETSVITCTPETWVEELMNEMTERRVRHLPVVDGGKLVGIVSIGDILKNRLQELENETCTLRGYLHAIR